MESIPEFDFASIPVLESMSSDDPSTRRVDMPNGQRVWLVSSYDEVRTVLGDERFSSDDQIPGYPRLLPITPGTLSIVRLDEPRHGKLRHVLTPAFTFRRIEMMRPGIEEITRELIEAMRASGPPGELIEEFALPLPSKVICQLLGVPYEDHNMFQHHSRTILRIDTTVEQAADSLNALGEYIHWLAMERRANLGDDLLSVALHQQEAADMTDEDVVALARLLLIAGHETASNQLGLCVLSLFQHPDQFLALRQDPTLMGTAVEELLRYHSVVRTSIARVAVADATLPSGQTIQAGEGVVLGMRQANHDPDFLTMPEDFDIRRKTNSHLAFGHGIHRCLGQTLARVELQIALTELIRAFPDLRPTDGSLDDIRWRSNSAVLALRRLPVTW